MRTRYAVIFSLALIPLLFVSGSASAHVLIADTSGKTGAILHLSPNDDPVAGSTTGMYYDVQTSQDLNQAALHLQITNESGGISESVLMTGKGHTAAGAFIFPQRGLYYLEFSIGSKVDGQKVEPLAFKYSVRITSSVSGRDPKPDVPVWATFGIIASAWGLAASILVFIIRRRKIIRQSK